MYFVVDTFFSYIYVSFEENSRCETYKHKVNRLLIPTQHKHKNTSTQMHTHTIK